MRYTDTGEVRGRKIRERRKVERCVGGERERQVERYGRGER